MIVCQEKHTRKVCFIKWPILCVFVLLHKLLHTLRFRFALYIATSVAASRCTIKCYIHCYIHLYCIFAEAQPKRTVWPKHCMKQTAKDVPCHVAEPSRQSLLHTMVHPLFSRGASENAPYLAVSLCIRTYETLCVLVRVAKPNDKVWKRLWFHAEQQRTDHSVSSHKQQWMDHFMKHNE